MVQSLPKVGTFSPKLWYEVYQPLGDFVSSGETRSFIRRNSEFHRTKQLVTLGGSIRSTVWNGYFHGVKVVVTQYGNKCYTAWKQVLQSMELWL